ncbi:MAG: hypothetical protein HRU13_09815 [Phycisphaerales bacterium]|nr:hypothetical protein [Phycisphaerales bacterium]
MPRNRTRTPSSLAIAAVLISVCPAVAIAAQAQDDDIEEPTPADPLLAGPDVGASAAKLTLVQRDFSGEFQRLDRHPAEAALELVLDHYAVEDMAQADIQAILLERQRVLDDLVVNRLDLLVKLSNGGNERDRAEAIRALRQAMAPIAQKGAFGDRIRQHLPADAAAEHERLQREYTRAATEHRVELLKAEDPGARQRGLRLRAQAIEILVSLGDEVKRAYERTLVQDAERLESLIRMLDLSPEQEGKVRAIVREYGEKTLINKEAKDDDMGRLGVFLRVAAELTPEQRQKLMAYTRGEQ